MGHYDARCVVDESDEHDQKQCLVHRIERAKVAEEAKCAHVVDLTVRCHQQVDACEAKTDELDGVPRLLTAFNLIVGEDSERDVEEEDEGQELMQDEVVSEDVPHVPDQLNHVLVFEELQITRVDHRIEEG